MAGNNHVRTTAQVITFKANAVFTSYISYKHHNNLNNCIYRVWQIHSNFVFQCFNWYIYAILQSINVNLKRVNLS